MWISKQIIKEQKVPAAEIFVGIEFSFFAINSRAAQINNIGCFFINITQ